MSFSSSRATARTPRQSRGDSERSFGAPAVPSGPSTDTYRRPKKAVIKGAARLLGSGSACSLALPWPWLMQACSLKGKLKAEPQSCSCSTAGLSAALKESPKTADRAQGPGELKELSGRDLQVKEASRPILPGPSCASTV